jgi:alpha-beta hydrolase superfamily lysophospholipase
MGTGGPNPASGAGLAMIRVLKKSKGERSYSPMIEKLMFGSYNQRFGSDDKYNWLSTLQTTRDDYRADRLCTFSFTLSAMEDLVKLQSSCNKKQWFKGISSNLPILLVSGADDPVGDYGKGVKTVYDKLKAAGKKVKFKLYRNSRHEILNDACRIRVINEILGFIN